MAFDAKSFVCDQQDSCVQSTLVHEHGRSRIRTDQTNQFLFVCLFFIEDVSEQRFLLDSIDERRRDNERIMHNSRSERRDWLGGTDAVKHDGWGDPPHVRTSSPQKLRCC